MQLMDLPNPIIIVDNNSSYGPLLSFYDIISKEVQKVKVIRLRKNYGHEVYLERVDLFPAIYILSDPDLQLNKNMPRNVSEVLYKLSEDHKIFKVGLCLDISDSNLFIKTNNFPHGHTILEWESQFWKHRVVHPKYELYRASIDTTFTLVNWKHYKGNTLQALRIGGKFTAKHLPWYQKYIENNVSFDELSKMRNGNRSSTILSVL
jgi:hypothetical protein